jgi:hypothetical protein
VNLVKCKVCGEGYVIDCEDQFEAEYIGFKENLTLHYKTCDFCDSEFVDEEDMRKNKKKMLDFKHDVMKRIIIDGIKNAATTNDLKRK